MEKLTLVQPSSHYLEEIRAYKQAFEESGERLHGGNNLANMDDLTAWLDHVQEYSSAQTCPPDDVPSSVFLCIRQSDQKMVGICNIRHHINHPVLLNRAGHIGYSIRPDERRKGYATEQLRLALLECKNLKIDRVLVTAADWNIASQKTILAKGGVYEDSRLDENSGENLHRYWIDTRAID